MAWLVLLAATFSSLNAQPTTNTVAPVQGDAAAPYKKLSLQELMSLDVTSVARQPQPDSVPRTEDQIARSFYLEASYHF